ncbi:MAG: TnsA endonuclease N-terminal domain-containing protein [Anaerolineae bacterium]|nr:TnsA endonuclease N-terminal domain-containing protein [Anaerolineae bacterium]
MPVRKVYNRGNNIIGKFPSLKMKRMILFESTIERDYIFLLDYEAGVTRFEEQPLTIEYNYEGKKHGYTPDFHVVRAGQKDILVDCKPHDRVDTAENRPKFAAADEYCARLGWQFAVVTDTHIRSGSRLSNVKLLTRYACYKVRPETKGHVLALLHDATAPLTVNQLQAAASLPPTDVFVALMQLAYYHQIVIPLDNASISANSPVSLPTAVL